ncbi:MAG TPA: NAD(P)-binding domain-containing protein [Puia sp.]|nr:NAD(P)-binding domain-containing protein [Puia sp.]
MATRTSIAIVEATEEWGAVIAGNLARDKSHRLLLMSTDPEKLDALVSKLTKYGGAELEAISCAMEACWEADIIVLAVEEEQEEMIMEKIKQVATGKIVISISPRLTDGKGTSSHVLRNTLPFSRLVEIGIVREEEAVKMVISGEDDEALLLAKELLDGVEPGGGTKSTATRA